MPSTYVQSLQTRLTNAEESLRLVQERQSEFVQAVNVPLELVRDERRLQKEIAELRAALEQVLADKTCPYRSLQPFGQEHASFFFGREEVVSKLVEKVRTSGLMVVVGPSGSGKSSLLQAGLIHTLKASGQAWEDVTFRPRKAPLDGLASALVDLHDTRTLGDRLGEIETIAKLLRENAMTASRALSEVLGNRRDTSLLLIVDQFEELYTQTKDELTQRQFIDALLAAADSDERVHVVLAVRADFYGYLLDDRELGPRLDAALFNVRPLSRDELRAAIEGPARVMGRAFEPGLADVLLAEVAGQPGNLPLLEFALTELWDRQAADRTLTFAAYDKIGRVTGALAQTAENVFAKYEHQHQEEHVRRIFIRLVQPGVNTQDTRRRASRSELEVSLTDLHEAAWSIVRDLADSRLVVTGRDSNTREETAEIAHEALIGAWQRLAGWIEADREFLTWRQSRLDPQLQAWIASKQDPTGLLQGETLMAARRWLRDRTEDISDEEREFVFESIMQRDGDLKSWAASLRPVNKALRFLDGCLTTDDAARRGRAVQALRHLHIPGREKRVYIRLECLVLRDPSAKVRHEATASICERGEITQLADLLDRDLQRQERQYLVEGLVHARNQPGTAEAVQQALDKSGHRYRLRTTWQLIAEHRNEFALALAIAYLLGELASRILAIVYLIRPQFGGMQLQLVRIDILIVLALLLYLHLRRTHVDQGGVTRRDRLLAGLVAAIFSLSAGITSSLFAWDLIDLSGHLGWAVVIACLALFSRPIALRGSPRRESFRVALMSCAMGELVLLLGLLLLILIAAQQSSTAEIAQDLVSNIVVICTTFMVDFLRIVGIVFAVLFGFHYGLRMATEDPPSVVANPVHPEPH